MQSTHQASLFPDDDENDNERQAKEPADPIESKEANPASGQKPRAKKHPGLTEGERRKDSAHRALEARRRPFVLAGRKALLDTLLSRGRATPDDVRDALGDLPEGIGPRLFGAIPGPLSDAGAIRCVGYQKSRRPVAHARPVAIWEIADRAQCETELRLVAAQLAALSEGGAAT